MKVAAIAALAVAAVSAETTVNADVVDAFKMFQTKFGKDYQGAEWAKRLGVFADNLARVSSLNDEHILLGGEAVHGITKFMDLTPEEFKATYLTYRPSNKYTTKVAVKPAFELSNSTGYDWRDHGAVSAVKDQGQCGSCWAFSATEAIESYNFLSSGKLIELSPQQINSCDTVDLGCNGGNTESAYDYVKQAGGIATGADYPYTSGGGNTGKCKFSSSEIAVSITGYTSVQEGETHLHAALTNGPVSVCLAADAFQTYSSGILKSCPGQIDHCVQAVGFHPKYWIIRNSWATDWGEEGFLRLSRGKNLCHVADDVTFPTF